MKQVDKIIFLLLFGFTLFVSLNRHSRHPRFEYHSQLFADKAGYHVYLPAFFYYAMNGEQMPDSIGFKTGQGFRVEGKKIITKYPIGVAMLHAPFFGAAAALDALQGKTEYLGYTENQFLATNWSSAVYIILGLLLLFILATRYWKLNRPRAYLLLLLVYGCTNLLYYTTRDGAMSHGYSFFCFSLFLYFVHKLVYGDTRWQTVAKAVATLLVAISARHINALFLAVVLIYLLHTYFYHWKNIPIATWLKGCGVGIVVGSIPLVLQVMYNTYAYGSFGVSGYESESFSNWNNIKLLELWFAPGNGALLYAPTLLLAVLASLWYAPKEKKLLYFPVLFISISLLYAAWWTPQLGCGFGNRGYTEFLLFFSIPLAFAIKQWSPQLVRFVAILGSIFFVYLFILQWNFDGCWYGDGLWDWKEYASLFSI